MVAVVYLMALEVLVGQAVEVVEVAQMLEGHRLLGRETQEVMDLQLEYIHLEVEVVLGQQELMVQEVNLALVALVRQILFQVLLLLTLVVVVEALHSKVLLQEALV
jgi:hypothetical protein